MTRDKATATAPSFLAKVFFLLLCLPLLACQKTSSSLPRLRIAHAPHDHHAPLYIAALHPDYFRENGGIYLKEITSKNEYELVGPHGPLAQVIIQQSNGGEEIIRKLAEHHFDLAFGGVPAILHFIDRGKPLHIIAPVMSEGAGVLVSNAIPADNWQEFVSSLKQRERPVRIGYRAAASVQNIIFEQVLKNSGITYSRELDNTGADIILLNLYSENNLIPALEQRLIDGFVAMQPFLALAESRNLGRVIALFKDLPPEGSWAGIPCCALAADDAFVRANPQAVAALTSLLRRAGKFISAEPETSARLTAAWLGHPPEIEAHSLPTIKFLEDFDAAWERNMICWIEMMIGQGLLKDLVRKAYETGTVPAAIYSPAPFRQAEENLS